METPSSMRRVTRSQASSLASHKKQDDATTRSRTGSQSDRAALSDITNDSPIVGLAVEKTPSSAVAKSLVHAKRTPGSGEALLRCQVKNLLDKVGEEGAGLAKKTSSGNRSLFLRASVGFPFSPAQLLAPTPANTPLVPSLSVFKEEGKGSMTSPYNEEVVDVITTIVDEDGGGGGEEEEEVSGNECVINRALLFDSPGKSEGSDDVSSTVTYQGSLEKSSSSSSPEDGDDDSSSAWSLQVNVSGIQEDGEVEDDDDDDEALQELCEELMKMTVKPEFAGKHTRFNYNSDDELEGEEEVVAEKTIIVSPNVVLLKGLPVPQGKHIRFLREEMN